MWVRRVLVAAVLLLVAVLAFWGWVALRPGPLPGTRVEVPGKGEAEDGESFVLPAHADLSAWLRDRARLMNQRPLIIHTGFHVWRVSYSRLGARFDPQELLRRAEGVGRSANPLVALRAGFRALVGQGIPLRWTARITDPERLHGYVKELAQAVYRPGLPGTFDEAGAPIDGIPSEELNTDLTFAAIERAVRRGRSKARVRTQVILTPMRERRSRESFTDPESEATTVMIEHVTRYNPRSAGRARNIELAATKLNGTLLMPGARLSFNEVVGKRSFEQGFAAAAEVREGRLVDPSKEPCASCVGGGVCQVAGTLHAAAFFAGLDVIEHHPHTRLSSRCYLPPGLDTAVAWRLREPDVARSKDFILRNSYPFPLLVDAEAREGQVRIRLRGADRPYRVECCYDVERIADAADGAAGAVITRQRTVYKPHERPVFRQRLTYPDSGTCMRSPKDIVCERCAG